MKISSLFSVILCCLLLGCGASGSKPRSAGAASTKSDASPTVSLSTASSNSTVTTSSLIIGSSSFSSKSSLSVVMSSSSSSSSIDTNTPPKIISFMAGAKTIARGQSTLLTWDVNGADRITIEPGIGIVSGNSLSVSPKNDTTYTLIANHGQGQTKAQLTVKVIAHISLEMNANYFSVDGKQQFLILRNIAANSVSEYSTLFDKASREGTRIVRMHLSHAPWGMGYDSKGQIEPVWLNNWEQVLDKALENNLYVIPVFSVWADWNDGSKNEAWHVWDKNPINILNGGIATTPSELFKTGSATQQLWLRWMQGLVQRWQSRPNMLAWETFSELDLATGTTETLGVTFAQSAAAAIRQADTGLRPVTASLASWNAWPTLYSSSASDITQVHIYGPYQDLDGAIISAVKQVQTYKKAVIVGESGVDFRAPDSTTLTTQPQGIIGSRNASWAALISGAANGRALWWEDSYIILQNGNLATNFVLDYPAVETGIVAATGTLNLNAMQPLDSTASTNLVGGIIGKSNMIIGWYRSQNCGRANTFPPSAGLWDCTSNISGANVKLVPPSESWIATFYDPTTGQAVGMPVMFTASNGLLQINLPTFAGAIAFILTPTN
jgi:Cellulase (glycosyl hydrolase family 5)